VSAHPQLSIDEFCETGSGGTPSRATKEYYGGNIPWVKSGELREGMITDTEEKITERAIKESSAKVVPSGAILLAMYGATVGRMAFLGVDAATNQAVCNIRPDPKRAYPRYVFHCLQSKINHFLSRAAGGAQPNISQGIIKETKIPLPPLDEQRRIAAILDKADELRCKRKHAVDLLDRLTQSIFKEMFDGSAQTLSISELLSRGWLVLHKDGNHGSNYPRADEFGEDGVPFLSAKSIDNEGFIDPEQIQYLGTSKAETLKIGWIEAGDVLLAHNASVGKVALYEGQFDKALIGTSLTCYRPNPKRLLSQYLMSALRSQFFQSQLTKSMGQTTRNQVPITAQRDLKIPIPSIEQQRKYSDVVAAQMKRTTVFRHGAVGLEMLFSSLQSRAFSGQL
jgi:type I restriction enzyme S subunit